METVVSFDQFCPVAVSLDALGDRWAMLLMRDLLWAGPQSHAGLLERNPSLTPDALDATVGHLVTHGLVEQLDEPKARYQLTPKGNGISEVISALFTFGLPLLDDVVVNEWMLAYAIADCSRRKRLELLEIQERSIVRFVVDEGDALVELSPGLLRIVEGHEPQAVVTTDGSGLASLLSGTRCGDDLLASGDLTMTGDTEVAARFLAILPADH